MNTYEEVKEKLKKIIRERFDADLENLSEDDWKDDLLKLEIGFEARDLLCLYFDIEQEFGIAIPEEDIVSGRFGSLRGIVDIIQEQLQREEKGCKSYA